MFPWSIARSAEAVLSRWAVKRLCKFFLKKKLGKFIIGDIDVDQLDVQLSQGTFQLSDLALDVDYVNDKLGATAPVMLKEGSIGFLSVKMPWKGNGFQVEVDELELVLAPCQRNNLEVGDESTRFGQYDNHHMQPEVGNPGHDRADHAAKSNPADIHEGVKTIAKMVKWFLASFHVKVKNLIFAYEPHLEKTERNASCNRILVLRISEVECGTCVSEDTAFSSDATVYNFLGISRLTNFVKFQGAVLELLQMDNAEEQTDLPCASGSGLDESLSKNHPSSFRTTIMTGEKDGFSGNLKLSIPWKNGSLDIRKVDADVCFDPVKLKFQPSTIRWFLFSWESFSNLSKVDQCNMQCKLSDSVSLNSDLASHFDSSTSAPTMVVSDKGTLLHGSYTSALSSLSGQESASDAVLPGSQLIHDWVPNSMGESKEDGIQEQLDLGASMDQFFECFDGMRNSQSALGSSGMWNWTCSVFSALTAASSLASGSLHIPSEQQHVQTNVKATLAGFSIILSFQDEDQMQFYDSNVNQIGGDVNVHFLGVQCKDIAAVVQVCPKELRFEGTLKYIEVADYTCNGENATNLSLKDGSSDGKSQSLLFQHLQYELYRALPPISHCSEDPDSDELSSIVASEYPFGSLMKIKLVGTSGVTRCQFTRRDLSDGIFTRQTSFSLQLPQFILWVNFQSINTLFDLLKNIGESIETNGEKNGFPSVNKSKHSHPSPVDTLSSRENLQGSISVPSARIILCFPFVRGNDSGGYCSWNQFIAIDISTSRTLGKGEVSVPSTSSRKIYASRAPQSLHLNVGDLSVYLVNPMCGHHDGIDFSGILRQKFCAQKILSISNGANYLSTVSLLWQGGRVTGPWIAEKAKNLATSEESRSRKKNVFKSSEFAATCVKDPEDTNTETRDELILSSAFCVHVDLFSVTIDLSSSQYGNLHNLLNQMINGLSGMAHDSGSDAKTLSISQTSIFVECESVEIIIRPDVNEDIRSSLQSELPGSWYCLKLNVQKFNMLSVSSIGGIGGANFFWLTHGEGKLWGSITGVPDQEFLLISCSNSTRKRGDGGGSNVLSSMVAGSNIVHLWDPRSLHDYMSINMSCGTLVAVGGRLDWLQTISSFFSFPSAEVEKVSGDSFSKQDSNAPCGTFVLKLVDVGLSYEPHFKNSASKKSYSGSSSLHLNEEMGEQYISCLLAASCLTLSNKRVENSVEDVYKIRVQDIGLLLCMMHENLGGCYSADYLNEMGYVKVAREALVEANLRTSRESEHPWQLECTKSHIYLETCHDTTSGMMQLAAQLQQLFAPDLEESIMHLQSRWNDFHLAQENNKLNSDDGAFFHESAMLTTQAHASIADTKSETTTVSLMDEICEDAFHLDRNLAGQVGPNESPVSGSLDECVLGHSCLDIENPDLLTDDSSFDGLMPIIGLENCQTSFIPDGSAPEFIEGYCLPELCHLAELSIGRQSSHGILSDTFWTGGDADLGRGNSGWYGDASLSIVENHISEGSAESNMHQSLEDKPPSTEFAKADDFEKVTGRVSLKNVDVSWRMYAGSDWHLCWKNNKPSTNACGRNTDTCLELALSGMQFEYNFFPVDGICASKLTLSVQVFYIYDESKTAPWKLVLGYYHSKDHPRESSAKAFKLDLEAVRPDRLIPLEEYRLRVAFLPMVLHLHQSHLDFLISFFGTKSSSAEYSPDQQNSGDAKPGRQSCNLAGHTIAIEALLPFFQKFDIWPILVRVDYIPHRVDLAALGSGKYVELVNLVPWKGVELQLKHVHSVGAYGWGSVCETVMGEWLEDISQNQIHKLLQGLPTIRSLVAVGAGAAKLISSPVESYKKDQRVLKGMQRGTIAFLRSISLEAVGLGLHLASGAHDILVQAEYILASIPSASPLKGKKKSNVRCNQPKDAQQGIWQAYESLSDGLGKSASALVRTPFKKYQRGASAGSVLATAVRAVPTAAIAPLSGCANAAHCALLGLRNSLDPEHKKESVEKYLGPSQQHD